MDQTLYTVAEAATILKLHVKTLRKKIRDGELEFTRVGKQYRISQSQLESFCGQTLSVTEQLRLQTTRHVFSSAVIHVDAISPEESSRVTNTLMAALNSGQTGIRLDSIYLKDVGQLKLIINGDIETTRYLLKLIDTLT